MRKLFTKILPAVALSAVACTFAQAQKATASATQTLSVAVPAMISVSFDNASITGTFPTTLDKQQYNVVNWGRNAMAEGNISVITNCDYDLYTYSGAKNLTGTTNSSNTIAGDFVYFFLESKVGTAYFSHSYYPLSKMVGSNNKKQLNFGKATGLDSYRYAWVFDQDPNGQATSVVSPAPDTYTGTVTVEIDQK